MVALLDSQPASTAIPARFRDTARELLSETWSAVRAIDNAWHTTFAEFEGCRAELLTQQLRSAEVIQAEQLRLDQLRAQLTGEHLQTLQQHEQETFSLRTALAELQEQRKVLEFELEHARQHANQVNAELAELRQQQALDREGVQAELRQLRLAVERPWSGMPVAHEHSPATVSPVLPSEFAPASPAPLDAAIPLPETPAIEAAAAAPPVPEPGINSVLNHFQTLQKDLARRRAQPKSGKTAS